MLELFKPVKPMLCRYWYVKKLFNRTDRVGCEIKFDGIRAMIHKKDDDVKIFSRSLKDITNDFSYLIPDIQKAVQNDVILDCELISDKFGNLIPAITHKDVEIDARFAVFDIIYLDGKDITGYQLYKRKKFLEDILTPNGKIFIVDQVVCKNIDEIRKFFIQTIKNGQEGIIVKRLDSEYYANSTYRSYCWIKCKPRRD